MGTLKRAWWLALAVPALLGVAALASADDGWEARLLRQVEQLESKLKDQGEPLPPTGSIEDRVRAIEGATAKLEKRRGVDPKPETYYEGSSESQRLVSLTNAVVSLRRRLDALPNGEPGQGGGASAGGEEESSASRLEFQVVAGLWGDQTAAEQAAQFVKSLDHERLTLFVASVQREAQRGPPDEYLADEARRSQVSAWLVRLSDEDTTRAQQAALELGYSEQRDALPALVDVALHGRERGLRSVAIDALVMLGYLEAVPHLIDLITDSDVRVGNRASEAVTEILARVEGARSESGPAAPSAGDDRPARQRYFRAYFKRRQVELLRRSGQGTAGDGSDAEQRAIPKAVAETARAILDAHAQPLPQFEEQIAALSADGRRALVYALRAEVRARRDAQAAAAPKPWSRPREAWLRVWLGRIRRPEGCFAAPAANELGDFASPAAVDALSWALREHTDLNTRIVAALALGRTRCVDALPPLIAALGDKNEYIRVSAYGALSDHTGYRPGDEGSVLASRSSGHAVRRLYERWFRANEKRLREDEARRER